MIATPKIEDFETLSAGQVIERVLAGTEETVQL